jgi:CubicO group peptidase (beta-lactamase class C family)
MHTDAIFDLASLTKVYTAILTLQLVDQGKITLDAPLQRYLPEFTGTGKDKITIAMLLAHTSALPVGAKVTGFSTNTQRWHSVLTTPLVNGGVPGTTFRYSSVGLMLLGRLVEKMTGQSLDRALRDHLTTPLGLKDTGFKPLTWVGARTGQEAETAPVVGVSGRRRAGRGSPPAPLRDGSTARRDGWSAPRWGCRPHRSASTSTRRGPRATRPGCPPTPRRGRTVSGRAG